LARVTGHMATYLSAVSWLDRRVTLLIDINALPLNLTTANCYGTLTD